VIKTEKFIYHKDQKLPHDGLEAFFHLGKNTGVSLCVYTDYEVMFHFKEHAGTNFPPDTQSYKLDNKRNEDYAINLLEKMIASLKYFHSVRTG